MSTGGGHTPLQESMAVLGVPTMTKKSFIAAEKRIGSWWATLLEESMVLAGQEERHKAIDRNSFFQGDPAITVILDGGWSKRSHKHSYNAKSGVGVIIGLVTGKYYLWVVEINIVLYVINVTTMTHQDIPATKTGMAPPQPWKQTSLWRGLRNAFNSME